MKAKRALLSSSDATSQPVSHTKMVLENEHCRHHMPRVEATAQEGNTTGIDHEGAPLGIGLELCVSGGGDPIQRASDAFDGLIPFRLKPPHLQSQTTAHLEHEKLLHLEQSLQLYSQRQVDPQRAAWLCNRFRPETKMALSHAKVMETLTQSTVNEWYMAQGMSDKEIAQLRRWAFRSGLPNPSGTFLNNAIQFMLVPWVNYWTNTAFSGVCIGLTTAILSAPMNACQQSAVVAVCQDLREKNAPHIISDKGHINEKYWLPELIKEYESAFLNFHRVCQRFDEQIQSVHASNEPVVEHSIRIDLHQLQPCDRDDVSSRAEELITAHRLLEEKHFFLLMTQGAQQRHREGNFWQTFPRTLRPAVAGAAGLITKAALSQVVSPLVQSVSALVITGIHFLCAGYDEKKKQKYNTILNFLYGDFFRESALEKMKRGQHLEATDIDEDKLRSFIRFPVQKLINSTLNVLNKRIRDVEMLIADARLSEPGNLEEGPDKQENYRLLLDLLKQDVAMLRAGHLSSLNPDGLARSLILSAEKSMLSPHLWGDIVAKYTWREFSAQTAQRLGQSFHLGVFGSAVPSVIGKVLTAATGGARQASTLQTASISVVSGFLAAIGAMHQHLAISIKNNRREGEHDIGFKKQVLRGVMAAWNDLFAMRRGRSISKSRIELEEERPVAQMLALAHQIVGQQSYGQATVAVTP